MSSHHHPKKQNFIPYLAVIIGLVILIAIVNAVVGYHIILTQRDIISRLENNQSEINTLYHGIIVTSLAHNGKKLQALIDAHNEMIQAIENATGHHTPIINKITNIHNSYCTLNQVYVPPSCHRK